MPIQIFCQDCKTGYPLDAEFCVKCGTKFGRQKKYRVRVQYKNERVSRVVDNLTLAREVESTLRGDLVRGDREIKKRKPVSTLNDVWKKYLPWAQENKKSWQDDEWYYGKHIGPRFGEKRLDAIAPIDIERMKIELKKSTNKNGKPYAAATIKHQIVLLRRLYNVAIKWRMYSGENPVSSVEMPKLDNQVTEYLTDEQAERLMQVIDEWPHRVTASLVKFALLTGCRAGEIRRLQWNDIDFEKTLVTLRDPKGGVSETIPVCNEALDVVRKLEVTSDYVFPNPDGGMRGKSSVRSAWNHLKKHAGLPDDFRYHGLRHNFASQLVSSGVDLAVVQKLMTHKHASTTARYAHLRPDVVKQAASMAGKIVVPETKKSGNVVELKQN